MGRPSRSNSTANLPFPLNVDAGRQNANKSFSRTLTSTSSKPFVPRINTLCSVAIGSAKHPSSAEDEIFYDALEDFEDAKPQSSPSDLIESGGAQNGYSAMPTFATAAISLGFPRGPSKPATSPITRERFPTSPVAAQAQAELSRLVASVPPSPKKKALLIGINYEQCGKKDFRLRHATEDARRFATTLSKLGYSSENTKIVTDEQGQPFASCEYLLECIDWLIRDASAGDRLFFMFSGHCLFPNNHKEPHLVAADMMSIPRSTFQERLVSKVPTGAELTIVLDCCHAAGMVKLKYRIGLMTPELDQTTAPAIHSVPHYGSLHGLGGVGPQVPASSPQGTPPITHQFTFSWPSNAVARRSRPIAAASLPTPTAAPDQVLTPAASLAEIVGPSPSVAVKQIIPAQRRQLVVQGAPVPQFRERKDGFVTPAGKVIVWAGTGERLKAFEASGGVKSGIVTNAFCGVLDKCHENTVTRRDLWKSLVDAVGDENRSRRERDARKPNFRNIPINTRLQLAELWVSQQEALSSSSPILNQVVERPWNSCKVTA